MGFSGIVYGTQDKRARKSLNGFYGIKVKLEVNSIRITDFRGYGLQNVKLEAINPTSGVPFIGYTDKSGSAFMDLDNQTDIILTKNGITKVVQYDSVTGDLSPTYTIDLPFIQNN